MIFYFKHFDNKIEFTFCNGMAWPFCSSMLCQRWRRVLKSWCNNRIRLPPLLVVCKNTVSSVHCAELLLFSCKSTDLEKSESDFVKPLCSIFQSILNNMPKFIYMYNILQSNPIFVNCTHLLKISFGQFLNFCLIGLRDTPFIWCMYILTLLVVWM